MEGLSRLVDLLGLRGWRAFFIGLASFSFIAASYSSLIPPLGDAFILVVCAVGFVSFALGVASFFEWVSERIERLIDRRNRKKQTDSHRRDFINDINNLSEREKEIFGYLRAKKTRSFSASQSGGHAATLIGRGYIKRDMRPGQFAYATATPFIVPIHIWETILSREHDFPWSGNGSPPWHDMY